MSLADPMSRLPRLALQIAIAPGVRVEDAAQDMIQLADQVNFAVIGSFSGLPISAFPGDSVDQVKDRLQRIADAAKNPILAPNGRPV